MTNKASHSVRFKAGILSKITRQRKRKTRPRTRRKTVSKCRTRNDSNDSIKRRELNSYKGTAFHTFLIEENTITIWSKHKT